MNTAGKSRSTSQRGRYPSLDRSGEDGVPRGAAELRVCDEEHDVQGRNTAAAYRQRGN